MKFLPPFTLFTETLSSNIAVYLPGAIYDRAWTTAAVGGFIDSAFSYRDHESRLWNLVKCLGYRGRFTNRSANTCWLGFLHSVTLHLDAITVTYSLEKLANRVREVYTDFEGADTGGEQLSTDWAEDTESQSRYGIREQIITQSEMTDAAADRARDNYLSVYGRPFPIRGGSFGDEKVKDVYAEVQLRGFWTTSAWQIYYQAADADEDNSDIIQTIITNECPKISTDFANVMAATGVTTWTLRDEQHMTAQDEILRLMAMGWYDAGPPVTRGRLAGGVYEGRKFHLKAACEDVTYRARRIGSQIFDAYNQPVDPWDVRPDNILFIEDLEPYGNVLSNFLDDPRYWYIDQVSYHDPGVVNITPLGQEGLTEIFTSMGLGWFGG